jgi:hypothetical protein
MTIDEFFKHQPFWTLAAVVVGFMLGEGSRYIREKLRIWRLKRTIRKELKSIKFQIPQKKDILSQLVDNLKKKALLPGLSVPIVSVGYNEMIKDLYDHLSSLQRNCLHVIYERVRIADKVLGSFKDDFLAAAKGGLLSDPWKAFTDQFEEIDKSYDVVLDLIDSYLSGIPIDVFDSNPPKKQNGE